MVKDFGLSSSSVGDQVLVENLKHILANLLKLILNLGSIGLDGGQVPLGAAGSLLLLDGRDDAPASSATPDNILVGDTEQVTLIEAKLATQLGHLLHVLDHLIVPLGLLAETSEEGLAMVRR